MEGDPLFRRESAQSTAATSADTLIRRELAENRTLWSAGGVAPTMVVVAGASGRQGLECVCT
jgi:hypothetical protein